MLSESRQRAGRVEGIDSRVAGFYTGGVLPTSCTRTMKPTDISPAHHDAHEEIFRRLLVVVEDLRDDIKVIAEHQVATLQKLDNHEQRLLRVEEDLQLLKDVARMTNTRLAALEARMDRMEQRLDGMDLRMDRMEQKLDLVIGDHEQRLKRLENVN